MHFMIDVLFSEKTGTLYCFYGFNMILDHGQVLKITVIDFFTQILTLVFKQHRCHCFFHLEFKQSNNCVNDIIVFVQFVYDNKKKVVN